MPPSHQCNARNRSPSHPENRQHKHNSACLMSLHRPFETPLASVPRKSVSCVSTARITRSYMITPAPRRQPVRSRRCQPMRRHDRRRACDQCRGRANSAARSRLVVGDPSRIEPLSSITSSTASSRSSTNCLMCGSPVRALTFQSMDRISSPGSYGRTPSKCAPRPRNAARYAPISALSTSRRVRNSSRVMRFRRSGGISAFTAQRRGQ